MSHIFSRHLQQQQSRATGEVQRMCIHGIGLPTSRDRHLSTTSTDGYDVAAAAAETAAAAASAATSQSYQATCDSAVSPTGASTCDRGGCAMPSMMTSLMRHDGLHEYDAWRRTTKDRSALPVANVCFASGCGGSGDGGGGGRRTTPRTSSSRAFRSRNLAAKTKLSRIDEEYTTSSTVDRMTSSTMARSTLAALELKTSSAMNRIPSTSDVSVDDDGSTPQEGDPNVVKSPTCGIHDGMMSSTSATVKCQLQNDGVQLKLMQARLDCLASVEGLRISPRGTAKPSQIIVDHRSTTAERQTWVDRRQTPECRSVWIDRLTNAEPLQDQIDSETAAGDRRSWICPRTTERQTTWIDSRTTSELGPATWVDPRTIPERQTTWIDPRTTTERQMMYDGQTHLNESRKSLPRKTWPTWPRRSQDVATLLPQIDKQVKTSLQYFGADTTRSSDQVLHRLTLPTKVELVEVVRQAPRGRLLTSSTLRNIAFTLSPGHATMTSSPRDVAPTTSLGTPSLCCLQQGMVTLAPTQRRRNVVPQLGFVRVRNRPNALSLDTLDVTIDLENRF